jgi:hypothetical protein
MLSQSLRNLATQSELKERGRNYGMHVMKIEEIISK